MKTKMMNVNNKKQNRKRFWRANSVLETIDMFGANLPMFNIEGR